LADIADGFDRYDRDGKVRRGSLGYQALFTFFKSRNGMPLWFQLKARSAVMCEIVM
jgi:hypothetical protein